MGKTDRLREEGMSEDEIAEIMDDGKPRERAQNPETARLSYDPEPEPVNKKATAKKAKK